MFISTSPLPYFLQVPVYALLVFIATTMLTAPRARGNAAKMSKFDRNRKKQDNE